MSWWQRLRGLVTGTEQQADSPSLKTSPRPALPKPADDDPLLDARNAPAATEPGDVGPVGRRARPELVIERRHLADHHTRLGVSDRLAQTQRERLG